ncbi:MAG: right-handed parallel beta-helix repeat-containing protein [Candidatus Heimdallarchaeaceae archaeon]|jgi:parallel beta-helix repeat protein
MESLKKIVNLKNTSLLFLVFSINLLVLLSNNSITQTSAIQSDVNSDSILNQDILGVVFVQYDEAFIEFGFPGNGTKEDPYIIENINITPGKYINGIRVARTTKHFIIRNCFVFDSWSAIQIMYVKENTATIQNCSIVKAQHGLHVESSDGVRMINNTVMDCEMFGAYLTKNCELINNTFHEATVTCRAKSSNLIENNTFANCGIYARRVSYTTDNEYSLILRNNQVNNLPVGFFIDEADVQIINMYGQIILINCSNISIKELNIKRTYVAVSIFESNNISVSNSYFAEILYGIKIYNSSSINVSNSNFHSFSQHALGILESKHLVVKNCEFSTDSVDWETGIAGSHLDSAMIINCQMLNLKFGIAIGSVHNETNIENCYFQNVKRGITLNGDRNLHLLGNKMIGGYYGLFVKNYDTVVVENNTCIDNKGIGMEFSRIVNGEISNNSVERNKCGLKGIQSRFVNISNNYIIKNRQDGLCLIESENCSVVDNLLEENSDFGVSINMSSNNQIYSNVFLYNNPGGFSQAKDDQSTSNIWFNFMTKKGNFWSDLGDYCFYLIDGSSRSTDIYPLNKEAQCVNPTWPSTPTSPTTPTAPTSITSSSKLLSILCSFVLICILISYKKKGNE